jgi:glycosyltransferase involved in cell wall biosynthesis
MPGMKERPSVYHLITRMDMGGSAQNTLLTCLGLSRRPYSVTLAHGISQSSSMARPERRLIEKKLELARRSGVTVREIPSLVRRIDPVQDVRALIFIYQVIRRHRYDILHSHTSKAGIIGRWAARMAGVPIIVHTPHGHIFFGHFSGVASTLFLGAEKVSNAATDILIALTDGERNDYLRLGIGKPGAIRKVHSGVNIRKISEANVDIRKKRTELGLDADRPLIGTVGWLLPIKGPDVLLRAGGSHPQDSISNLLSSEKETWKIG